MYCDHTLYCNISCTAGHTYKTSISDDAKGIKAYLKYYMQVPTSRI